MSRLKTVTNMFSESTVNPSTFLWSQNWVETVAKAYKYYPNGNIQKELDALGYLSGTGSTTDQKIDSGYGTEYTYNLAYLVVTVKDPVTKERSLSYTTSYEYDALGRKISETDAKGQIKIYEYNDAGNNTLIGMKKSASSVQQTILRNSYDLMGRMLSQTDGKGNVTNYQYNDLGKVRNIIYASDTSIPSNIVTFQYDRNSNLKKKEDTLGTVDLYTYDKQNRLIESVQRKSDGSESILVSAKYDKHGNKRFETDGRGVTTTNVYDEMHRIVSSSVSVSGTLHTTINEYDKNGNLIKTKDWRNNTISKIYDPINRLIEEKDPYDKSIRKVEYNKVNSQIKSYDVLNNLTQYQYDKNNRLLKTIDPELHETSQTYDNVGNIATKEDGRKNVTTYNYDEFNRLESVVNAKTETTRYTYDLNNNMLTQIDGKGNITTYEYNVRNLLTKKIDHGGRLGVEGSYTYIDSKVESNTYYSNGLLKTKTDRNRKVTTYIYDIHGRLSSETCGTQTISYTYDKNGNQLTASNNDSAIIRTYDELGRVLTKTDSNIGTTTYQYDRIDGVGTGETKEVSTDPKENVTVKVFDKAGRLKTVTADGKTTTYNYYANGSRQNVLYDDGAREEYIYYPDNTLWMLTNLDKNGITMDAYTYYYDDTNNQNKKNEVINGVTKGYTEYTYDVLNRLDTVTEPDGKVIKYDYDSSGNRKTETIVQDGQTISSTTYSYNEQNRLNTATTSLSNGSIEATRYYYDNNGNMITQTKETIRTSIGSETPEYGIFVAGTVDNEMSSGLVVNEYNEWNQLVKTAVRDQTLEYGYNGDGYRSKKIVNGEVTKYLYEYDKVVLEVDATGNQLAKNIYGTNLIARTAGSEQYYYMYNGHGDVTALVGTDGTIEGTYYYDVWGNIVEQTGSVNNSITYAGYQYDNETELYYLNARYYDSHIGRFISEDTYSGDSNDPLTLNLYIYVSNNPIKYIDPTGHWQEGDDSLPAGAQAALVTLTTAYYNAKDDIEKEGIHQLAEAIRSNSNAYNNSNVSSTSSYGSFLFYETTNNVISSGGYFTQEMWSSTISDDNAPKNEGKGSTILFQHGVNAGVDAFEKMTNEISTDDRFIDGGTLSLRNSENNNVNTRVLESNLRSFGIDIDTNFSIKQKTFLLNSLNENVMFRTEFSSPTGQHQEQIRELGQFVDEVSMSFERVKLVGHSKGGLISVGYTAENPERVKQVISINTPYQTNAFAKASSFMPDLFDKLYEVEEAMSKSSMSSAMGAEFSKFMRDIYTFIGSMGTQKNYNEFGGMSDLANDDTTIRNSWNNAYNSGRLNNTEAFAIATNVNDWGGDGVVSFDSQKAPGYNGIRPIEYNVGSSWDFIWTKLNNLKDASHISITGNSHVIYKTKGLLQR